MEEFHNKHINSFIYGPYLLKIVTDRDTKQGRQARFIIAPQQRSTSGNTVPTVVRMQIVDKIRGKATIHWK
jgi:hypothetical protein